MAEEAPEALAAALGDFFALSKGDDPLEPPRKNVSSAAPPPH